jgi:putative phage-type endonuclease
MTIIQLEQGSKEWLEYRQGKIMATDISIIIGSNHFKTARELWEEKLGLKEPTPLNEAMKRGQTLEQEARQLANFKIGFEFEPCVFESDKYSWMAASLDGLTNSMMFILEIKCPKERTHVESIEGTIPSYYLDQMQHQLLCTGAEKCYYFSYRPEFESKPYVIIEIFPDLEKHEEIISKGKDFYLKMCTMSPPEEWKLKVR